MKSKIKITVLTLLSLSCVNRQNGAHSNVDKNKAQVYDISSLKPGKNIAQIILNTNVRKKSFSSSELNRINYSKLFTREGLLNIVAYYDNRRKQSDQPSKFEDFLIFEVSYDNSENAKKAFEQIKSDADLSNSKEQIEFEEELGERIELLKLEERYGGLITCNEN